MSSRIDNAQQQHWIALIVDGEEVLYHLNILAFSPSDTASLSGTCVAPHKLVHLERLLKYIAKAEGCG